MSISGDDEPGASYRIEVFTGVSGSLEDARQFDMVAATCDGTVHIEDVRFDGPGQYVYFKVTQDNAGGRTTARGDAGSAGVAINPDDAVIASGKSAVYHTNPECPGARSIKASNRISGAEAKQGRRPQDCPDEY